MSYRVSAREVAYHYPQNNHGVNPVSLNLAEGERLFVAGPSGCGKSTLARCLTGLIPHLYRGKLEGSVWLDGLQTTGAPLWQLAERAGLVFQNPAGQMLTHSVEEEIVFGLENLGLGRAIICERLEAVLGRFGLESLRERSPQTLSGGEQQKLALAAVTARQPPVLVLDEPLSMLDGTAAEELVAYLTDLGHAGTTLIICEHREEYLSRIPGLRTLRLPGRARSDPDAIGSPFRPWQPPPFHLDIDRLSVRLGGRGILRDVSLSLAGGQVVAVVGRNGVGKTTLLRAMMGLQKHEGSIEIRGEEGESGQAPELGMVFQNADLLLFNASVREEILYRVPGPDMTLYTWLLDALGLADYEGVPPLLLSEGEKKRAALAMVLMRQPRHGILLDEPSLGQDGVHKALLMRLMRALGDAGQLVAFTTHDLPLAAQADRLILLGPEGCVSDGPPERVFDDQVAWARIGLSVPAWVKPPSRAATTEVTL